MIVVSDTSAIWWLCQLGEMELLRGLFHEVILPPGVFGELTRLAARHRKSPMEIDPQWIHVRDVQAPGVVQTLLARGLDEGEAQAIALALEIPADLLLMDEALGRSIAAEYCLRCTGLGGVLIEAKRRGLIDAVAPRIQRLADGGFWLSSSARREILRLAGE